MPPLHAISRKTAQGPLSLVVGALLWLLFAVFCAAHMTRADAGELKLSTVQLRLTDAQPRSSLTVTNAGALPSMVHVRVQRWSQPGGVDSFSPAPEIIVNPPIIAIKAGAKQLVRVGYSGPQGAAAEGSYRMFIEEVPMNDRERPQAIETYLHISLPIFIGSPPPSSKAAVANLALTLSDGAEGPALRLANHGAHHVRMIAYRLSSKGGEIGFENKKLQYVLPGAEVVLPALFDNASRERADSLVITTDDGALTLPIRRVVGAR